jgi:hypothetical protein
MTPQCQAPHCHRPTQQYLCQDHTQHLANMLDQLPGLLDELDTRIQQLARTTHGTIGRTTRDPAYGNPIDFDAAEQARQVRKLLLRWVQQVAQRHTGRQPAALYTADTKTLAKWLHVNLRAITRLPIAGRLYQDIARLVGTDSLGGQLHQAIDRTERHYFGPCTATIGRDRNGQPRECGTDLWADREAPTITCPTCTTRTDARTQLDTARIRSDLRTFDLLTETLDNLGEHVPRVKLSTWITTGRLTVRGWYNKDHGIVKHPIRRGDPRVFSLAQARQLRRKDRNQQEAKAK